MAIGRATRVCGPGENLPGAQVPAPEDLECGGPSEGVAPAHPGKSAACAAGRAIEVASSTITAVNRSRSPWAVGGCGERPGGCEPSVEGLGREIEFARQGLEGRVGIADPLEHENLSKSWPRKLAPAPDELRETGLSLGGRGERRLQCPGQSRNVKHGWNSVTKMSCGKPILETEFP